MAMQKVRQFAGDFRLWAYDNSGDPSPVIPEPTDPFLNQPIETDSLSFSYTAGDETKILSKRRGGLYQQPIYDEKLPGTTEVTIKLLETPVPILARALYGTAANADISTGSATAASVTIKDLDVPFKLPHRCIKASPTPTFTKSDGSTPLVAGTDYKLDIRTGTIMILSAGTVGTTLSVGDTIKATYEYESVTGTSVVGGAVPSAQFRVIGDMQDRNSGEDGLLTVYAVNLAVDGDFDWLSSEPLQPTLKGTCLVPAGAPAPYTFDVYKVAA